MKEKDRPVVGTSLESMLDEKSNGTPIDGEAEDSADSPNEEVLDDGQATARQGTAEAPTEPETDAAPVIIEDVDLLYSFIEESRDHLENIEEKILKLESSADADLVDEIFRPMHTMKGTSAFFGFSKVKNLSHALESLLDDLRQNSIELSQAFVDTLLGGVDLLAQLIRELQMIASEHGDQKKAIVIPESEIDIQTMISLISQIREAGYASADQPEATRGRDTKQSSQTTPSSAMESLITDEIKENFIAESVDLVDAAEELILELEKNPADTSPIDGAFRCIHTVKGNAGFLGYAALEDACMDLEGVLDALRSGEKQANSKSAGIILGTFDSIRGLLSDVSGSVDEDDGDIDSEHDDAPKNAYKPLGSILVEMGEISETDIEGALDMQERKLGEILLDQGKVSQESIERALSSQHKTASVQSKRIERKDIRVDMSKLDKLFDLMGELITAEAMVLNNPELEGLELESFDKATSYLSKITREMQEITMSVRMIPLEGLFNKMRRLVRDLSKRFGKDVDFSVFGQDTEMDRNVIEEIADPLMHIIRNSIDHGIESETERRSAGKGNLGSLVLGAKYEGNEIWISVTDDGAGLHKKKILSKARDRGLIKPDAELKDEEIWQLIFEPGFSTAEQVSEVSGRGVGMDVVKKNVDKLRGKIDIESESGSGTTMTLKIPLTLAIIDGITAQVSNVLYAFPLSDILEFHKATADQITSTNQKRKVIKLRDEIIPIINLHSFFSGQNGSTGITDGILIITQRNGKKAALLVDEVVGYQQIVVKALPEYMGVMRAISGCSILGNGEVSLIIDVGSLLKEEFNA